MGRFHNGRYNLNVFAVLKLWVLSFKCRTTHTRISKLWVSTNLKRLFTDLRNTVGHISGRNTKINIFVTYVKFLLEVKSNFFNRIIFGNLKVPANLLKQDFIADIFYEFWKFFWNSCFIGQLCITVSARKATKHFNLQ